MKFAVVVFPGSNCDHDAYHAAKHVLGQQAEFVWHKDTDLRRRRRGRSCPAGSRTATTCAPARSPASRRSWPPVAPFAAAGGPVLGICNGFQILLEAGLLPGAMLRNRDLKFHCEHVSSASSRPTRRSPRARRRGPGAAHSDRPRRGQLLRRARRRRRARARPPGHLPLRRRVRPRHRRRQSERLGQQHRRHLQRGPQRRRPDAASRARLRAVARQRRRPGAVRVGRQRAGRRRACLQS